MRRDGSMQAPGRLGKAGVQVQSSRVCVGGVCVWADVLCVCVQQRQGRARGPLAQRFTKTLVLFLAGAVGASCASNKDRGWVGGDRRDDTG